MPRLSKIGAAALAAFGWTGLQTVTADFLVVAGGGGGGSANGGGGGAGGYRTGTTTLNPTLSYTVTVGAGGAGGIGGSIDGVKGSDSIFSTITSTGGGFSTNGSSGGSGGSGGGAGYYGTGGAGNTPSTSPSQGNNGGTGFNSSGNYFAGGGGGGASAVGSNAFLSGVTTYCGNGGNGTASSISGTSVTYAGGGGASGYSLSSSVVFGTGGSGGGGNGNAGTGSNGTSNLGGGGGAGGYPSYNGGSGGSGVVIISYTGAQQFGGGVVTSVGGNTIHTFNTSGTLSPLSSLTASCLVIAGGGGGGSLRGGGGGAGGYRTGSGITIDTNSIYAITVGAGGPGGAGGGSNTANFGTTGTNSVFSTITSNGGGGGGKNYNENGLSGGSGGGGGPGTGSSGGAGNTPNTSPSQGNNGGNGGTGVYSGGGGGSNAVGVNGGTAGTSGAGGAGTTSSITGSAVTRAGGGGGGGESGAGGGGAGGGGDGTTGATTAEAGDVNTGSGGGGGGYDAGSATSGAGGAGGSGVVIISYPGSTQQMAGGTVTVAGGNVIHTFTSSGYLTPIVLVNNSLRFRSSASAYLNRTPASAATSRRIMTYSAWVKIGTLGTQRLLYEGYTSVSDLEYFYFNSSDQLEWGAQVNGGTSYGVKTPAVFRDPSAWYHIVCSIDTTQATDTNRVKIYVNGVQQTGLTTFYSGFPAQNTDLEWNNQSSTQVIGWGGHTGYYDGYMAEINMVDGQALTPSSFGSFNGLGAWQPIRYGGSYGTNGFYLPFTGGSSYYGSFNGSNQYLQATLPATLTGAFTVESYFYRSGSGNNYIFTLGDCKTSTGVEYYLASSGTQNQVYSNDAVQISSTSNLPVVSAWNHVAFTRDSSNVTRLFVNGVQVGSTWTTAAAFSSTLRIGVEFYNSAVTGYANGGLSNFRVINGTALYTSNFAPPTSALTAVSGTAILTLQSSTIIDNSGNSLSITNNGTVVTSQAYPFTMLGNQSKDYSPQGNNWTNNNIGVLAGSTLDIMTDVPTLTSATTANYCVWSPINRRSTVQIKNTLDGNLNVSGDSNQTGIIFATIYPTTGKWYYEFSPANTYANSYIGCGNTSENINQYPGNSTNSVGLEIGTGKVYSSSLLATYTGISAGEIGMIAWDCATGKVWMGRQGTWFNSGDPAAGTGQVATLTAGEIGPIVTPYLSSGVISSTFGQRPFVYTPPTGFVALNTYNLPTPTIGATASTTANKYFDVTLYTGAGGTQTISGLQFQPDFIWGKARSVAYSHALFDSVRGYGSTKGLVTNSAAAEGVISAQYGFVSTNTSTGFTAAAGTDGTNPNAALNESGVTYVAWNWKANGAGVTNTNGSIISTVSANTTAGFSIVTYTGNGTGGSTVGHGCQVNGIATAPSMIIYKRRTGGSDSWIVYHASAGAANSLTLNNTNGVNSGGGTYYWGGTAPTNLVFSVGTDSAVNTGSSTYVAYCFAEVAGYSKIGSYTGTGAGDSNGPFIYCGFRPAFILLKADAGGYNWAMMDTDRPGYNSISYRLFSDVGNEENTVGDPQIDFLSNGFKLRAGISNYSGTVYYIAFAENHFKYANAR